MKDSNEEIFKEVITYVVVASLIGFIVAGLVKLLIIGISTGL